jgi:MerR family transcriptional regulator, light-induced transcriptional regulator
MVMSLARKNTIHLEQLMRHNPNFSITQEENCREVDGKYDSSSQDSVDILIQMLDKEIIPRLLVSHQANTLIEDLATSGQRKIHVQEVDLLVSLCINGTQETCLEYINKLMNKQVSIESIYLDLIPMTARKLGVLWEEDICSFTDVTIGLWRLQHILYDLTKDFQKKHTMPIENLNALLIPAPKSQHTLGLFIVAEFFRKAGWRVWGEPNLSPEEINNLIFSQWFDVIGISVGYSDQLEGVNHLITSLRSRSMNPNVAFMVGGPLYATDPELFDDIQAEIKSCDANDAIRQAEIIVGQKKNVGTN